MEIVGEFLGHETDKGMWLYFKTHWFEWFPWLGSRTSFLKQASNLWKIKQEIQKLLIKQMGGDRDNLHMADGFPVPICHFRRAKFSQIFKGSASYGYCASKKETYYGFKGNVMINSEGLITSITLTPAHVDERESLWEIISHITGLVIADKGLIGEDYRQQIRAQSGINLQTPLRSNMSDARGKEANCWLVSTRRLVETVIGQLTEQFHIQKVRARDLWHLTNRITRKVLAHTVGIFMNKTLGNQPLQFEHLLGI